MIDYERECVPIAPLSSTDRCRRGGPNGREFIFGTLTLSHETLLYSVDPEDGSTITDGFGNMALALDALERHHQRVWCARRGELCRACEEAGAIIDLIGTP